MPEEAERYPEWEPTLESTREPEEKLFRKEEELRLADRIIAQAVSYLNSIPTEDQTKNIMSNLPHSVVPVQRVDFKRLKKMILSSFYL